MQEDFYAIQAEFAEKIARSYERKRKKPSLREYVPIWVEENLPDMRNYITTLATLSRRGSWTASKFSILDAQLREFLRIID